MRAKFINEKFEEHTDPISDMDIGGMILDNIHSNIHNEAAKKWIKFLKDTLEGKTIKGRMMKWNEQGHNWKDWTIQVKKVNNNVSNNGFDSDVNVTDINGDIHTILGGKKIYIIS